MTIQSGYYSLFTEKLEVLRIGAVSSTMSQSIPQGKIVLTYDDYCLLPNDRSRYEILDGELSETPAPATKHQIALGNLHRILSNHVLAYRMGRLLLAPTDLILASTTVVQPDLIFIGTDRSGIVTERGVEGAPTLVIEILSPTTHRTDRQTKPQLYARYGVPHYWLLDPDRQVLESYLESNTISSSELKMPMCLRLPFSPTYPFS